MTPKRPTSSPFRARTAAAAFVCIVVVLAGTAANAEDEEYANYFEFQAGLTSGAQADGDLSLLAFMANGYVDFDLGPVKPWIGAGIGGGIYKIDV